MPNRPCTVCGQGTHTQCFRCRYRACSDCLHGVKGRRICKTCVSHEEASRKKSAVDMKKAPHSTSACSAEQPDSACVAEQPGQLGYTARIHDTSIWSYAQTASFISASSSSVRPPPVYIATFPNGTIVLPWHQWPEATSHASAVDDARYSDSEATLRRKAAEQLYTAVAQRMQQAHREITRRLQTDIRRCIHNQGAAALRDAETFRTPTLRTPMVPDRRRAPQNRAEQSATQSVLSNGRHPLTEELAPQWTTSSRI